MKKPALLLLLLLPCLFAQAQQTPAWLKDTRLMVGGGVSFGRAVDYDRFDQLRTGYAITAQAGKYFDSFIGVGLDCTASCFSRADNLTDRHQMWLIFAGPALLLRGELSERWDMTMSAGMGPMFTRYKESYGRQTYRERAADFGVSVNIGAEWRVRPQYSFGLGASVIVAGMEETGGGYVEGDSDLMSSLLTINLTLYFVFGP